MVVVLFLYVVDDDDILGSEVLFPYWVNRGLVLLVVFLFYRLCCGVLVMSVYLLVGRLVGR